MKVTLVMEYAELSFDLAPTDVPLALGASLDLPLPGYTLSARVTEVVISFPASRFVLRGTLPRGRTFYEVAADLERADYACNVTARDLDDDGGEG
ncbi:hypothetical protein ACIG3E_32505 [Streptomyces sp. NPDC053474]|uniref:hypothetical protein n=1 Tax=Streptomyces sp. NPDC053474 TaxID=3365704 RepID=UPI0037D5809B